MLQLPEGYHLLFRLDLMKNKKQMLMVNGLALIVAVGMVIPAVMRVSFMDCFGTQTMVKLLALAVGSLAYIVLHELTHAVCMKHYSKEKVRFGFTGMYAFAGSDAYYYKKPYLVIALAPVVLWGVVLLILNWVLPVDWFWPVYAIQVSNLSGAAGDAYVTYRMWKLPDDVLVRDSGTAMNVYGKR